jgi:hypothetical protein
MEQVSVSAGWDDEWTETWATVGPPEDRTLEITGDVRTLEQADG